MGRVTSQDILARKKQGERTKTNLSEAFVTFDVKNGPSVKILRLIGYPFAFKQHSAYKRDAENPKEWVKAQFPDWTEQNAKIFTRVCTENNPLYGTCTYCEAGFKKTQQYSQRCLERTKDENGVWHSKVKIISKGPTIFDEFANFENTSRELNEESEDGVNDRCEHLGGLVAHDIRIKSETDDKALGGVAHTITVLNTKKSVLTEDEINSILSLYNPTDEEFDALVAMGEVMEEEPKWYVGGYKLHEIHRPFRPQQARTPAASAPVEASTHADMTIDETANDDETGPGEPIQATPAATAVAPKADVAKSAKKTKTDAVETTVVESADDFDPFADGDPFADASAASGSGPLF